jgi:hypothetical protein
VQYLLSRLSYHLRFYFYFVDCNEVDFYVFWVSFTTLSLAIDSFSFIIFLISLISFMYCHDGLTGPLVFSLNISV